MLNLGHSSKQSGVSLILQHDCYYFVGGVECGGGNLIYYNSLICAWLSLEIVVMCSIIYEQHRRLHFGVSVWCHVCLVFTAKPPLTPTPS